MRTVQVAQQNTSDDAAQPAIVAVLTRKSGKARRRLLILCIACAAVIVAAIGGMAVLHYRHLNERKAVYAAQQRTLETSLSLALNQGAFQTEVDAASQLIAGKTAGNFTVASKTLAEYYMQRGVAYMNLQQYVRAVPDFQKARSIDPVLAQASLQAEVRSRYSMEQRQQLIQLFQQLAGIAKNAADQRSGTPEMYQQYIETIQHNQELVLQ